MVVMPSPGREHQMKHIVAILLGCLIALAPVMTHAASIVKATYAQDGDTIALMVYTGSDGGPRSDSVRYWALLAKAPERAYRVQIKPDKTGGKTATLKGNITVSVEIRNQFNMGTVKTDRLTLVRDDAKFNKWYIPSEELKRIRALIVNDAEKSDSGSQDAPAND
jgi:hypothetical protein